MPFFIYKIYTKNTKKLKTLVNTELQILRNIKKINEPYKDFAVIIYVDKDNTMDKLTNLLQEAKPLYKQRKRRKTIAKMVLTLTLPVIFLSSICQIYTQGNDIYLSLDNHTLQYELSEDEFGLSGLNN